MTLYPAGPKVFLCYDREAFTGVADDGLRVTFDTNIRFRLGDLRFDAGFGGTDVLTPEKILLEIKTPGAIPLWLCRALSERAIFPSAFSKYGACYREFSRVDGDGTTCPRTAAAKEGEGQCRIALTASWTA
jgi:hypothetical protein